MLADVDRLRLAIQALLALAVLGGATFLGATAVIEGESVVALYSVALGAVGAGAVGGARSHTTTTTNGPDSAHPTSTSTKTEG